MDECRETMNETSERQGLVATLALSPPRDIVIYGADAERFIQRAQQVARNRVFAEHRDSPVVMPNRHARRAAAAAARRRNS